MFYCNGLMRVGMAAMAVVALLPSRFAAADEVTRWNEVLLQTIAAEKEPPPRAARALAMMHVAIYDALAAIQPTHRPYRLTAKVEVGASPEAAVAQAAQRVLATLYPSQKATFDTVLADAMRTIPSGAGKRAGADLGRQMADAVIAWRADDGSDRTADHRPSLKRGQWRPTPPSYRPALLPHWAEVQPFALRTGADLRQEDLPALDGPEYAADYNEIKSLGAANSEVRTEEQSQIARHWADGLGTATPAGHWNRIAQDIARTRRSSLTDNARLFALLNIGLADAAIVCWDTKYHYNCWRPVTAIRQGDADGNPATDRDANWLPLLETPPFPSCGSGHSTFSGTAATILILYFGTDRISFTSTADGKEASRSFTAISEAANEAGRSRVYGGIHFEFENLIGLTTGEMLGRFVFENYLTPEKTAPQPQPAPPRPSNQQPTPAPPPRSFNPSNPSTNTTAPARPSVVYRVPLDAGTPACIIPEAEPVPLILGN